MVVDQLPQHAPIVARQALALLHQAYVAQSDHLVHLSVDPVYDPLRNETRTPTKKAAPVSRSRY